MTTIESSEPGAPPGADASCRLAVFDIDGTLTDTNAVDDECFLTAVAEVLGVDAGVLDWSSAPHVTDSSLIHWLSKQHLGRQLEQREVETARDRFLQHLERERAARPHRFAEIPGAADVLGRVAAAGWNVAIATGGWSESAHLKLAHIGIDGASHVFASATDAVTRTAICQLALRRAMDRLPQASPSRIVLVGDAVWDVETARLLGWSFVGIATGSRAERLHGAGAGVVLPDLSNMSSLLEALETAPAPPPRD